MTIEQKLIYASIYTCLDFNPRAFHSLKSVFSPITSAWQAPKAAFRNTGLTAKAVDQFMANRTKFDLEKFEQDLLKSEVEFITLEDNEYPELLREIFDPPPVLYYRGALDSLASQDNGIIAVVGTRKFTDYGRQITESICEEIARAGVTIVSGLALGIDAIAHQAAVETSGKTIAVLGGGVDKETVAPKTNSNLAEKIFEKGGALVSEYPPFTNPQAGYFPARNRIIAGLSLGTIVTEAPIASGALITAKFAREENREVFAVPGNITYTNSEGCNLLIKLGAHLVASGQDVLDILGFKTALPRQKSFEIMTSEEQTVADLLNTGPLHVDEMIQKSTLAPAAILSTLTALELRGAVKDIGGKRYIKT